MLGLNLTLIDNDTCLTPRRTNKTVISNVYEGIPETILLNVVSWLFLILLFAILRNRAWDYGRLALVHTQKWTQLFYKTTNDAVAIDESQIDVTVIPDQGCLWFPSIFKISRERIFARCGPDASHYLSFQTQLLILKSIITLFALVVILPINFQGTLLGDKTTFGHTTIGNLPADSKWLWVHIMGSVCVVPIMVLLMKKCSGRIPCATALSSKTVMITNISKLHRNTEDIKSYLLVRYPGIDIKSVKLAYKVKQLINLEKKREKVHEARMYCLSHLQTADIKIQPYGCIVCCPWGTKNALEYYTVQEEYLNQLVSSKRTSALQSPLGIAFVTLSTEEMAQYILKSFRPGSHRNWIIFKAPTPSDINWENLEISYRNWYCKAIFINAILFLVLFFLTTPVIMVNFFNNLTSVEDSFIKKLSPLLAEFLPTLLLLSMSALMPVIVAYSDEWMSHWTKSKQNHATMYKTFFFLLFMVLILPSLGLTSAQAFVEWSIQPKNMTLRWECIFLADKGAFFVNYVITSALIGTALELLRFPELAMYAWRLMRIKSEAEKTTIRKEILSVFPFGIHYAWTLLMFTVSTVYSLTCPLITPFGLLYLCLKHLVDKYNIYYVYQPITMSGEGQHIHADAVKMVRIAILLLQLITALFFFLRATSYLQVLVVFLGFIAASSYFFFVGPFPTCKPPNRSPSDLQDINEDYIAPVLITSSNIVNVELETPSNNFYGSPNNESIVKTLPEIGSSEA